MDDCGFSSLSMMRRKAKLVAALGHFPILSCRKILLQHNNYGLLKSPSSSSTRFFANSIRTKLQNKLAIFHSIRAAESFWSRILNAKYVFCVGFSGSFQSIQLLTEASSLCAGVVDSTVIVSVVAEFPLSPSPSSSSFCRFSISFFRLAMSLGLEIKKI